ncbi:hypothetical protein Tco_0431590, partial [Tanacetum coccineum]
IKSVTIYFPTIIQTLRIASTQSLIDVVTAALPSPPLPPLPPSLYIPPPVDSRDDVPESELPPRMNLCLSTLDSRYEIGESSTARPTRDPVEAVSEVEPMTVGEVNIRVTELLTSMNMIHRTCTRDPYPGTSGTTTAAEYSHSDTTLETLRVMRDIRGEMSEMQAELLAHREQQRRARQPGPDARIPDHQDAFGDADSHI